MFKSKIFYILSVSLIICLSAYIRLYKVGTLPASLYWDEIIIGYDALSIAKTGKDHTGNIPITFIKSFGDYKNPLYIYLTAGLMKFTGRSDEINIRLISILSGILTNLAMIVLVKKWFKNNWLVLITGLLLAISPWSIILSRGGFEANLFLAITIWAIVCFCIFLENLKGKFLALSSILWGLTLYSYHAAKITTPLILLSLIIFFKKEITKSKQWLLTSFIVLLVFVMPFLNIETLKTTFFRVEGVSQVGQDEINNNAENLTKDKFMNVFRFFHDKRYILAKSYLDNYFKNISTNFLFFEGDVNTRHRLNGFGQMYLFELITIVMGIYWLLRKNKDKQIKQILLIILLIAPIPSAISVNAPHALRSILLLIPLSIFSGLGLTYLLKNQFPKVLKELLIFIILYQVSSFFHQYFIHYNYNSSSAWQYGYKETINYLKEIGVKDKEVIFTNDYSQALWYLAFYWPFEPSEFQKLAEVKYGENSEFWNTTGNFNNFIVKNGIDWHDYIGKKNVILVEKPNKLIPNKLIKEMPKKSIYSPDGKIVFEITNTNDWNYAY